MSSKVTVIWNFESKKFWDGFEENYDFPSLRGMIEKALRVFNPSFEIEEFVAIGPKGAKANKIKAAGNITVKEIAPENLACADGRAPDCRKTVATDRSLLYFAKEAYMKSLAGKKNILLITDVGFEGIVDNLLMTGTKVFLALPAGSNPVLGIGATATWDWEMMKTGGAHSKLG